MLGIMRPDFLIPEIAAMEIAKTVAMQEVIVHHHMVIEPVRRPAPSESSPTAAAAEKGSHINSRSKGKSQARTWIVKLRIVAVGRRTPYVNRIVGWDVNHLRIRRLNVDCILPVLGFGLHRLLRVRLELAVLLRAQAHALHRIHHVRLLRHERVAQIRSPANILVQPVENLRKRD